MPFSLCVLCAIFVYFVVQCYHKGHKGDTKGKRQFVSVQSLNCSFHIPDITLYLMHAENCVWLYFGRPVFLDVRFALCPTADVAGTRAEAESFRRTYLLLPF